MPLMSNIYLLPDYGKREGKGGCLGEGLPIYDGIDFASISFAP